MKLIPQILGIIAIIIWIMAIREQKRDKIAIFQTIANLVYAIQYIFLKAFTASAMNLLSFLRCFIFYKDIKEGKKISFKILIVFIIMMLTIGIFTYDRVLSILPIIITISYAISLWQSNLLITYLTYVIAAILWIYYNINVGAYISVVGNILEITFGIISVTKYKNKTFK